MEVKKIRLECPLDPRLTTELDRYFLPTGLLHISSYLKQAGYDCGFAVPENEANFVFVTATTSHFTAACERAIDLIHKYPKIFVVIGGPHITMRPQDLPPFARIIGVIGEGEITARELLDAAQTDRKPINEIPGVCYYERRDENNNLDPNFPLRYFQTTPRPEIEDLDILPPMDYSHVLQNRSIPLITSRGCPYQCTFCASQARWKQFRFHSADWVIDTVNHIMQTVKAQIIEVYDDLFIFDKGRLAKIIAAVKHYPVKWRFTCRANLFTREVAELISQLDIASVSFGFESGSDRILRLHKPQAASVAMNHAAWQLCDLFDIPVNYSMIIGHPEETAEDLEATRQFIQEHPTGNLAVFPLLPYPGTEVWKQYGTMPHDWAELNIENTTSVKIIHKNKKLINRYLDLYPSRKILDKVNIIMPLFIQDERAYQYFRMALCAIFEHTKNVPYDVTLVDDGCNEKAQAKLAELMKSNLNIRVITNEKNLGFGASCNRGFDPKYRLTVVINSDCFVTENWLIRLMDQAMTYKNAGIFAPLTDDIDSPVQRADAPNNQILIHGGKVPAVLWLVKRQCWLDVGGFDERFYPALFEDEDFCYRARLKGWESIIVGTVWVKHQGRVSQCTRPMNNRVKDYERNRRIMQNKLRQWQRRYSFDSVWNFEIASLRPYMRGRGLDLCCGNRKSNKDALGLDRKRTKATDIISDAEKLDFIDNAHNWISAIHAIEHFQDTEAVLRDWLRVVKPGGHLLLIVPHLDRQAVNAVKDHCHEFTPIQFKNIAERVGEVVQYNTLNNGWSFDCVIRKQ